MNEIATFPGPSADARPSIPILPGRHKRVFGGHPWVYSNEVDMKAELKSLPPGTIVTLTDTHERPLGTAMFNPQPLICARILDRDSDAPIDVDWLSTKFRAALSLRERMFDQPFYRLVHAEADGLPGLVVDRYGETCVLQLNTAGMDLLARDLVAALERVLSPAGIVLQRCGGARRLEGLDDAPADIMGDLQMDLRLG